MSKVYDFENMVVNRGNGMIEVTYKDPSLEGYKAIVIADSQCDEKDTDSRLLTMVARFPRPVLAEFNTHRVFSRNSASSRARSMKVTVSDVMNAPYVPLFTKNQKGMSGSFMSIEEREDASKVWLEARDKAVASSLRLLLGNMMPEGYSDDKTIVGHYSELIDFYQSDVYGAEGSTALSVHKQNANRLLEPYMWHEVVVTSSYWDNYFHLRGDLKTAQPEIYAVALLMERAMNESKPVIRDYHLPFADDEGIDDWDSLVDQMMISSGESAQVSYVDKTKRTGTATVDFGRRLMSTGHFSPAEHPAVANSSSWSEKFSPVRSNFSDHWTQLRGLYETGQMS